MLEMIMFAIVLAIALVVANVAATLILLKFVMSERFLKKYMDTIFSMTNGMYNDFVSEDDED